MNTIQVRSRSCGDEELTSIGVGSLVGHGSKDIDKCTLFTFCCYLQKKWFLMFHVKCLILKHSIVDALSTLAIALTEVSRLDHEALHYTMKRCSLSRR